jgi:hypothetical protein
MRNRFTYRFTYKELTLVIGIVVALVVIFTLWIKRPAMSFSNTPRIPALTKSYAEKKVTITTLFDAVEELLSNRSNPY